MLVRTLFLYLIGNRQAILDLAADRRALWVGLAFVVSAGFAREYDGQDLLREPWHLLVPVGASLTASLLLFLVACGSLFVWGEGQRPSFFSAYRSFLTLFWMTAPLGWLYAVPYERFLSPGAATAANLWTLAAVAAWRVALMVRVVSVLTGRGPGAALFLVMAFADAVALTAVYLMPKPVVSFMGGVRLTESEMAVHNATFLVSCLGIVTAPLWAIGGVAAFFTGKPAWQVPARPAVAATSSRGIWVLAVGSLAVWIPILPATQSEQRLRARVEADLTGGRVAEGLAVMSAHGPGDFPPHWDPPPRFGYRETVPDLVEVMDVLIDRDVAPWVRAAYVEKFRRFLGDEYELYYGEEYRRYELARIVRVLERLPEGPDLGAGLASGARARLDSSGTPVGDRESLTALLKLAEKSSSGRKP